MKNLNLVLSVLVFLSAHQVFAADCKLPASTSDLEETAGYKELLTVRPAVNLQETTITEAQMMTEAVNSNSDKNVELDEGVGSFLDVPYYSNAGQIEYFSLNNELFALVAYYPGDNEYGVVVSLGDTTEEKMRNADFTVVATVGDGDIYCTTAE